MKDMNREQQLLREFFSTLEPEDAFAKRKGVAVTTFRSLRLRYGLPSKGALVRVSTKAARALGFGKKNYLCKHEDCWPCRLVERRLNKA